MAVYRKPGVYLEEGPLTGVGEVGLANAYGLFVGAAAYGPVTDTVLITSWAEYAATFGGWTPVTGATVNYLPYAVWSFYQNGGRNAWIRRAVHGIGGTAASADVFDADDAVAFTVQARSDGVWGNEFSVAVDVVQIGATTTDEPVFSLIVFRDQSGGFPVPIERFDDLSPSGTIPGTKRVDFAVNDEVYGSKYVRVTDNDPTKFPIMSVNIPIDLLGGVDGTVPTADDLTIAVDAALAEIEGPIILNVAGYRDAADKFICTSYDPSGLTRGDVFVVNDNHDKRGPGQTSEEYGQVINTVSTSNSLGSFSGISYVASYTPWIVIPDPAVSGGTLTTPPGGAVAGMIARNDATVGVYQAPAGTQFGGLNNALNVDAKFSDVRLGSLNSANINVIRPITGAGIAVMGGRTRKNFAVDKYVNARRTLIYIKETLRRSCEFALFRNNDEYLWSALRGTADLVLRPVWAGNGLKGGSPSDAYIITCDASINTPSVIASGEVRMEIAVALQTPAEFVVIRVSQIAGGTTVSEI